MKKLIDFKGLEVEIQKYANLYHNGNFSEAVRSLLEDRLDEG